MTSTPAGSISLTPRIPMRRLASEDAVRTFDEVLVGYSRDEAIAEAIRIVNHDLLAGAGACLFGVDVPRFVGSIAKGDFTAALGTILEVHAWPGILGRHCSRPCERTADLTSPQHAPNVSGLERAAAEFGDWSCAPFQPGEPTGARFAVIGAGSTGGALVHRLRTLGHEVHLYDQLRFAGGMMRVGYPAFRLPEAVLAREWDPEAWGANVHYGVRVEPSLVLDLVRDFDGVAITAGKFRPRRSGLPGEELEGVLHALEFLVRFRTEDEVAVGEDVVVIGGGYTARDASRTALRLGARARILYRGDASEMPVAPQLRQQFVLDQAAEGAPYQFNTVVTEFLSDSSGRLRAAATVKVVRDGDHLEPIPGTEEEIATDMVLLAIGEDTDLSFLPEGVDFDGNGCIVVDAGGATSLPGLYAAGEIAGVGRTADSMRSGLELAKSLDARVRSLNTA